MVLGGIEAAEGALSLADETVAVGLVAGQFPEEGSAEALRAGVSNFLSDDVRGVVRNELLLASIYVEWNALDRRRREEEKSSFDIP